MKAEPYLNHIRHGKSSRDHTLCTAESSIHPPSQRTGEILFIVNVKTIHTCCIQVDPVVLEKLAMFEHEACLGIKMSIY